MMLTQIMPSISGDMEKPFAHKLVPKIQSWDIDGLAAIMVRACFDNGEIV